MSITIEDLNHTEPYEVILPKTKLRKEGFTHVFTGIRHTQILFYGNFSGELRRNYLARFWVNDGIAYYRRKTFYNPNDYFCIEWEMLIKI